MTDEPPPEPCPTCRGRGYVHGLGGVYWCACPLAEECREIVEEMSDAERGAVLAAEDEARHDG